MHYTGLLSRWLILPFFALSFAVQADDAISSIMNGDEVKAVIEQKVELPKVASKKLKGSQLIKELKSGGYVIFMRHAATEEGRDETEVDLENCETQRNLSEKGLKQAKTIGSAIKKLGIPVGDVHTSPYCRCVDTASAVFGQAQTRPELTYAAALESEEERAEYSDTLLQLLSVTPEEGANTVIVSHSVNLEEATGILPKPEGAIYVFKPTEEGYEHVGEIKPDFWDIFLLTAP